MSTLTSYKCRGVFDRQGVATYLLAAIAVIVVVIAIAMAFSGCAATCPAQRDFDKLGLRADSLNRVAKYWKRQHEEMDAYVRTLYLDARGKALIDSLDAVDRTIGSGYAK